MADAGRCACLSLDLPASTIQPATKPDPSIVQYPVTTPMTVPILLFLLSGACLAVGIGSGLADLTMIAGPAALASLILILRSQRKPKAPANWIVVDGSNVMHWNDGTPQIAVLRAVLAALTARGFTPGVVFDANAGYKLGQRYHNDGARGKLPGLPGDRVLVVPKGTPADPFLLEAARDLNARIVSNDRFRDGADRHPEVTEPGRLFRGGYRDGVLWLDLPEGG